MKAIQLNRTFTSCLITICLFTSACSSDELENDSSQKFVPIEMNASATRMIKESNRFATNIFRSMITNEEEANVVCSPLSMSSVLSIVLNGADGETANELNQALGTTGMSLQEVNENYKKLLDDLKNVDKSTNFSLANSIWINKTTLRPEFADTCQNYYSAPAQSLDFAAPASIGTINNWASQNTNGMIPELLSDLSDDQRMIIANAIYFQGKWSKDYFDKKNTVKREFHNSDNTIAMVNTMETSNANKLKHYYSDDLKISKLVYGNGAYEFIIAMPEQGTITEFLDYMNQLGGIEALHDMASTELSIPIYIPKLEIACEFDMKKHYQSLGIESLFDKQRADLPFMADERLFANKADHKLKFSLDEEGAKAAATSTIQFLENAVPPQQGPKYEPIHYDKPFVFCIMETSSKTALFLGKIEKLDF